MYFIFDPFLTFVIIKWFLTPQSPDLDSCLSFVLENFNPWRNTAFKGSLPRQSRDEKEELEEYDERNDPLGSMIEDYKLFKRSLLDNLSEKNKKFDMMRFGK